MALTVTDTCKRVSISSKRQITIPQAFFNALGFGNEAECIFRDNELILRPTYHEASSEFAEQILADIIKEGFSGEALLKEFKMRQAKVRPAVVRMLEEADAVAEDAAEYMTMDEVFGDC